MTQLLLKLLQPDAKGHVEAGAVASVRLLSDIHGKPSKKSWTQTQPLDIAGEDRARGEYSAFELPGGGYYSVEITPPRGSDISREFLVQDNEVRREMIEMEASPHEYLAWQQYAGIVPPRPYSQQQTESHRLGLVPADWLKEGKRRTDYFHLKPSAIPMISALNMQGWLGRILPAPFPYPAAAQWQPRVDDEFATWFPRMPNPRQSLHLIDQLSQADVAQDSEFPRWIAFNGDTHLDVASVPWPWWGGPRYAEEGIRFVYNRVRPSSVDHDAAGRLTISVQDRRWFGLLEFLVSGRLSRAGEMCDSVLQKEDPEKALYGKLKRPLAAVAGGIILVMQAQTSEHQRWDDWLENLSNWFPGVPDGAILLGYRRIQQATNEGMLRAGYDLLRTAVNRGIPFFSVSIRMLALALGQVGAEIPEADDLRRQIAPVSTRVDPDQPFTVIRYSNRS